MNNTEALRAAAQQALVALVHHTEQTRPIQRTADAIAALRAALAQPAASEEPADALWLAGVLESFSKCNHQTEDGVPLHLAAAAELRRLHAETTNQRDWYVEWKKCEAELATAQPAPARVPLTDEQVVMDAIMLMPTNILNDCAKACEYGIRYAERAHGITAPGAPDAGPVQ